MPTAIPDLLQRTSLVKPQSAAESAASDAKTARLRAMSLAREAAAKKKKAHEGKQGCASLGNRSAHPTQQSIAAPWRQTWERCLTCVALYSIGDK